MSKDMGKATKISYGSSKTSILRDSKISLPSGNPSFVIEETKFETLPPPTTSKRDKKEYKVIRLENGLTACLISDLEDSSYDNDSDDDFDDSDSDDAESEEETEEPEGTDDEEDGVMKKVPERKQKMAAAALCVGVGSFSDPKDIPGMAHFLEHMVFMGSEKFPKENDFDKFITKRGGSDNASTDCETTTFYFECLEKYLYHSLDKFAQFFISPLMNKGSMTREREAIESEFQIAVPNDAYRKEQLLASFFNPVVPVNQFSWGNLITLKDNVDDDYLYKSLHEFRKRHYSAHRMTLCIQGRLPLDVLQAFVLDCFKHVPNNNLPPLDFKQYSTIIYDNPKFNQIYYIIPNKNTMELELVWSLPSLRHLYKSKPHQYVSWLLGDEGKGSLMSTLREKVWALGIYTGNGETGSEHNSMYAYFSINLALTQAGLDNMFEVINLVFSYINLLKSVGPLERIFKEIQLIEETSFTFADEKSAADIVEKLAENMHFYPSTDYLTGSELYFEYKPDDIQMVLNYLRPDNMNVMVLNKNMPRNIDCNLVEPWFKTMYAARDIPKKWLETWTNVKPLPQFALSPPNKFLTNNFSLLPELTDNPEYPTKILNTDIVELWYRFDQKFRTPTAYYYFYLISPLTLESPINASMLDMFVTLLSMQLTEEAYPAQVADLDYSFSTGYKGMFIKLAGYNEKLPVLLELITKYLVKVSEHLTLDMFNAVKENQSMFYYNKFLKPSSLNKDLRLSLLLSSYWPPIEKHAAIGKVTFDMMKSFAKTYVRNLYIQGLIQGNIDAKTAASTTEMMIKQIGCEPLIPNTFPKMRVVQLPKDEFCCRIKSFNQEDSNSYVTNYYQSGPFNIKSSVVIEIIMMIIEEPLFENLRTKEQLGYSVFCTLRETFGILGFSISVITQAMKHSTAHVDTRIEAFIKLMHKLLKKMTDKKMNQFKRDLIKVKQCADTQLKEEVNRNWNEITDRDYLFDRLQQEIKAVEELKASDVKKFWEEHSVYGSKQNYRKLSIQVVGNAVNGGDNKEVLERSERDVTNISKDEKEYVLKLLSGPREAKDKVREDYFIRDIETFKHNLYLYPSKTSLHN